MFTQMGTSGNLPFSLLFTLDLILYALLSMLMKARIAQSVEHGANNARVAGSRPAVSILFSSSPHMLLPFVPFLLSLIVLLSFYPPSPLCCWSLFRFLLPSLILFFCFSLFSSSSLVFLYFGYYVMPFSFLLSVGSYQVGYTRSHPNTEVKMLRAC